MIVIRAMAGMVAVGALPKAAIPVVVFWEVRLMLIQMKRERVRDGLEELDMNMFISFLSSSSSVSHA